jgi:hypothetical protein
MDIEFWKSDLAGVLVLGTVAVLWASLYVVPGRWWEALGNAINVGCFVALWIIGAGALLWAAFAIHPGFGIALIAFTLLMFAAAER